MQHTRSSRLRGAFAVVAASALLVAGVATVSEAAGAAKSVLLGKSNKETKTTKIINKGKKPALALKSKGKGPALSVNTTGLVKNLNADLLDGKTLDQVSPTRYTASIYSAGGTTPASLQAIETNSIPAGKYAMSVNGLFSVSTGDSVTCQFVDYTRLLASGGTDLTAILLASNAEGDAGNPTVSDSRIASIVAGRDYVFYCQSGSAVDVAQAAQLVLEAVDRTAAVPGQAPFTPRPASPKLPQVAR